MRYTVDMTETVYVLDTDGLPRKKEPMTESKKKPSGPLNRWTDAEVAALKAAVKVAPSKRAAFQKVAEKTGRSVGTVQQKWYGMNQTSKAVKGHRGRVGVSKPLTGRSGQPTIDVRSLDTDALVLLAAAVSGEVQRRQSELAKALSALS